MKDNEEFKPYRHDERMGSDYYKHPTFGLMHFSRYTSSHNQPMFGSSILHNSGIKLTISHAELIRSNNTDRYFDSGLITEVEMSATQFADAITNMNNGCGIPVTIKVITKSNGENLHHVDPPYNSKVRQFNDEFDKDIQALGKRFDETIELAKTSHAQVRLIKEIELLKMHFVSNIPFVNEQFTEQMDSTVSEAKAEVEAFVNMKVQTMGIEAIRQQAPQLLEPSEIKKLPQHGGEEEKV